MKIQTANQTARRLNEARKIKNLTSKLIILKFKLENKLDDLKAAIWGK